MGASGPGRSSERQTRLMSKLTEHLLQVAAVVALLWFGYGLVERSVITILQQSTRAQAAEQKLQQCEATRGK